jgi:hypothetical protein
MTKQKTFFLLALTFFSLLVFATWYFGRNWIHPEFLPDQGPAWYYWKLPEPTAMARITGWGLFLLHLATSWTILFLARKNKETATESEPKYGELNIYNRLMLGTHMLFGVLHLVQTAIWYDTLAHDTPVWLSQYSVILMLVLIMILVNKKRGLFFGKSIPIPEYVVDFVRKYHSYYILLALTFTFWYHPMEVTPGHLVGFFYMFLLMIQSTVMYTKTHLNKYWIFILEVMVLFHGSVVALGQATATKDVWPLFAFGFGLIAVVTQIFILNLPKWANYALQAVYIAAIFFVYSGVAGVKRTFGQLYEITFIPVTEYAVLFAIVGIGIVVYRLTQLTKAKGSQ